MFGGPGRGLSYGRVTIRLLRPSDAKALEHELLANRTWLRKWEATDPTGWPRTGARPLIRALRAGYRAGNTVPLAILVDGELVGQLNISAIGYGSLSSASIGYWIAERAAGHGFTAIAVALATDYAFQTLKLHRIEICIRPENTASLRVVEKLGFRFEGKRRGYIHIDGAWRDHVCFALLSEEAPGGMLTRVPGPDPVSGERWPYEVPRWDAR